MAAKTAGVDQEMDSGEKRLNELGYKQELRREMVFLLFISVVLRCFVFILFSCEFCSQI